MGRHMDKLPTVISCCFCCFLRAGSVLIALVSFLTGVILAPNVSYAQGPWNLGVIKAASPLVNAMQLTLGVAAIFLCIISWFLMIGALCNIPRLIEWYQWGAIGYCALTSLVYLVLSFHCFIVKSHCLIAGLTLLLLIVLSVLLTAYFVIVVNSLRMSMQYIGSAGISDDV
ncbi:hypothetical protein NE865_15613 [Phthorimaea operculella]|nr:hypothetical protein NE865_15613 [Phthorimaea operculella]